MILLPIFLLVAPGAQAPADAPMAPDPTYRLVWSDEFDGDGLADAAKWSYDTEANKRGWYNEEKQYYAEARRKNSRVENGRLIIEAHREPDAARTLPDWGGQAYTSARLVTRGKANWTYGFFEVRAKLPCGRGSWPAIWTLADKGKRGWPTDGEIDIMEHVGHEPGVVHHTIHTAAFNHVKGTHKTANRKVADVCSAFHDYQLDWQPDRIRIGIDGDTVFTFDKPSDDPAAWPFDAPHYLILNVAVGGIWGGAQGIDDAAFPQRMEVDHVRVWQHEAKR